MYKEMSKVKAALFVITCWLTTFMVMWQVGEIIVANDLYVAFPGDVGIITAMLSVPTLLTAAGSLVAGVLLKKISTKTELIIAGVAGLFMIVAPLPKNMLFLFVCSLVAGVGAGFANTAGMSILSEVFIDEKLRARHMGIYNAAMAAIGALCGFIAGIAAVNDWTGAFIVNWVAVPMLIMTIIFLPNIRPSDRASEPVPVGEETVDRPERVRGVGAKFWIFFATTFMFMASYVPIGTLISVYVAENNFGTTAFAGICSSIGTVGSFCMGLLFGFIFGKLNRKLTLVITAFDVILYLLAIFVPSPATAVMICLLLGASYGAILSLTYAYAAEIVPISQNGMAMGIMTLNYSLAVTLGVYLFQYFMKVLGSLTATLWVSLGLCMVVFIIELIVISSEKKAARA